MAVDPSVPPNQELIKKLQDALELARSGTITDGVIVAIGPSAQHYGYSIPYAASDVIGEMEVVKIALAQILIAKRAAPAQQAKRPAIIPARFNG